MNGDGDPAFEFDTHAPPTLVSLVPFSPSAPPSTRRLSSSFTIPSRLAPSAPRRPLAWISLQGRIIDAEEASSARTIGGGGFSPEEAVAWELFTPIQRVLVVAVVAVAVSQSKKNREISKLQKSVRLRDQLLTSMQNKLDDLCKQVNNIQNHTEAGVGFGCFLCDQHGILSNDFGGNLTMEAASKSDDIFKYKVQPTSEAEQEGRRMSEPDERRMSGLSDWASSSVTSSADIQMNTSAVEQDLFNIKKECEEKEAKIEKLSTCLHSSDIASSKRISELEDIIRRKSKLIMKLRRDMVVLEQKVVHLTRLRRPSFSESSTDAMEHPFMAANVLYDMDSTTSPSSSDSDSFPKSPQTPVAKFHGSPIRSSELSSMKNHKSAPQTSVAKIRRTPAQNSEPSSRGISKPTPAKASSSARLLEQLILSRPASPLTEDSMNQRNGTLKPKQLSESSNFRTRKQIPARPKESAPLRKWV